MHIEVVCSVLHRDACLRGIWYLPEVVSKFWIAFKGKAQTDEKAQHIQLSMSILKRSATQPLGVRRSFETASNTVPYMM
jgi:hypothetical protein